MKMPERIEPVMFAPGGMNCLFVISIVIIKSHA